MGSRERIGQYTPDCERTDGYESFVGWGRENTAESTGRTYCVMAPVQPVRAKAPELDRHEKMVPDHDITLTSKKPAPAKALARIAVGLLLAVIMISSPAWLTTDTLLPVMKKLSAASADMRLPEEGGPYPGITDGETVDHQPETTTATTESTTVQTTATTANTASDSDLLPVIEKQVSGSGTKVGDIYVKNSTGYSPDFKKILAQKADCKIKLNAGYQVLIVHTHTTEGYAQRDDLQYSPDYSPRTTDLSASVVEVGNVLADKLEAAGIRTLHATEVHDHPRYNGSYDRALATIKKYLEQYPSIEMVLDVHRDAITYDDGTKLKPTAQIDGRKAAQVMIISGCDAGGTLYFPGWKDNLCMALQIQQSAQKMHPGLMRPLNFAPYRYNMHMTPNSLLLEFGTDANSLEEAVYSAELMGEAIAEVLLRYDVEK